MEFKLAHPGEASMLTRMAHDSKAFWGYTPEQLLLLKPDLLIDSEYIRQHIVYKVLIDERLIGFYALSYHNLENCFFIDHLWLIPDRIRQGIGRSVFIHIISQLKETGQSRVLVKGDPHARGFYEKMTGRLIAEKPSRDASVLLSVYEFDVRQVFEYFLPLHSRIY